MNEKVKQKGISNFAALILVAVGYPAGALLWSALYVAIQKDGLILNPTEKDEQLKSQQLSKNNALSIVKKWWLKRESIMAPPYDPRVARSVISKGPLWNELNRKGGAVDWLKKNNQYYEYLKTDVVEVVSFDSMLVRPILTIKVRSVLKRRGNGVNVKEDNTSDFEYIFGKEDGSWKLWDYRKAKIQK